MPPWITDAVLVSLITGGLGLVAGRISSHGAAAAAEKAGRSKQRELMIAPYEALAARVEQLETEASDQRVEADALRAQVAELRIEVANLRADRDRLARRSAERDRQWQDGWDELRATWDARRTNPTPPDYPTPKLP